MTALTDQEKKSMVADAVSKVIKRMMQEEAAQWQTGAEDDNQNDGKRAIRQLMERYRGMMPGSVEKAIADHIIRAYRKLAEASADEWRRNRYNLLILRYVIKKPMTDKEICKKMGMAKSTAINQIEEAFDEMAFLGYDKPIPE